VADPKEANLKTIIKLLRKHDKSLAEISRVQKLMATNQELIIASYRQLGSRLEELSSRCDVRHPDDLISRLSSKPPSPAGG
jgi:hypothetical protein